MGLEIPSGFGECVISMDFITGPSNPCAIVFGYENSLDQAPTTNAVIIRDEWESNIMTMEEISNNILFIDATVRQNPGGATGTASSGVSGAGAFLSLPPQVAILIRKQSAEGGRSGRGRMYMPGLVRDSISEGGFIGGASLAVLNTGFQEFADNIESNSIPMVILHSEGSVLPPYTVVDLDVDVLVATQRRRLRG